MLTRTPETLEAIEQAICQNAGSLLRASRAVGVSLFELNRWIMADPEVAARIKTAQLVGYASLEDEAYRRAVLGVEEPVYYKGDKAGTRTVYSDGLLQTLLKARVPGFSQENEHQGVTVNVNLMPRASTYEEWLEQKQAATEQKLLQDNTPVSDAARAAYALMKQPEDVDFVEVIESAATKLRDVL